MRIEDGKKINEMLEMVFCKKFSCKVLLTDKRFCFYNQEEKLCFKI